MVLYLQPQITPDKACLWRGVGLRFIVGSHYFRNSSSPALAGGPTADAGRVLAAPSPRQRRHGSTQGSGLLSVLLPLEATDSLSLEVTIYA